jgi:hypothetical protein
MLFWQMPAANEWSGRRTLPTRTFPTRTCPTGKCILYPYLVIKSECAPLTVNSIIDKQVWTVVIGFAIKSEWGPEERTIYAKRHTYYVHYGTLASDLHIAAPMAYIIL